MLRSKKGFTLIELLVAVFIILILAAIAIPPIMGYFSREPKQQIQIMTQEEEAALKAKPPVLEEKSTEKGNNKKL